MGNFLSVLAVRSRSCSDVSEALQDYFRGVDLTVTRVSRSSAGDELHDIRVFTAADQWVAVLFPEYFNARDLPLARAVTRILNTNASLVHTYDSEYWAHFLLDRGNVIDQFCSRPHFFEQDSAGHAKRSQLWSGDANRIASSLGGQEADVAAYLVHDPTAVASLPKQRGFLSRLLGAKSKPALPRKAFPDDEFDLGNEWVFADFWRRMGIAYPEDLSAFEECLRLPSNFEKRLEENPEDCM